MVVTATLLVLLLRRLNVPTIVTYLGTGLLVGPFLETATASFAEILGATPSLFVDTIDLIAELGIALLLFIVGLELSLEKIRDVGRVAVVAGIGQVVFTAAGGLLLTRLLGFDWLESVFLATALTFSSTVVVVKLLDQKKELYSLYGRIAVGIFLVQDLVVVIALTVLAGLGDPDTLTLEAAGWSLFRAFAGMTLLLGLALLASRYFLERPFGWAAQSAETMFIWSLGWCFLFVVLAEHLGLSKEIGAFLAGLSLAQLDFSHDLRRRLHPLMSFFIAIFFISLGLQMDLGSAAESWLPAVILSLFVLIGNPFIFMWIISLSGYSRRVSFLTSVTVAQISEFSFIFAAMGLSSGLIRASILSLVAIVGLVTIAGSAYMILYNHRLYQQARRLGLLRMFPDGEKDEEGPTVPLRNHVIVVGLNSMGRRLVEGLVARGETVLAIDTDPRKLSSVKPPALGKQGNVEYLSILEEVFLDKAKLAVSTLRIEDTNNLFAYRCRQLGVPVAAHAFDRSVTQGLRSLGVDYLIDSKKAGVTETLKAIAQNQETPQ